MNDGYLRREHQRLMHPRSPRRDWTAAQRAQAQAVHDFIAARGATHPREVGAAFAMGRALNGFGGASQAGTRLLDAMQYRGMLRVVRRDAGTRVYEVLGTAAAPDADEAVARLDALIDLAVRHDAPLPAASLGQVVSMLVRAVPQWTNQRRAALARATQRLAGARVDGVRWHWPADERPASRRWTLDEEVRLLTPFDPLVWDRRRFERLWGWAYRFEAYTPAHRRQLGYYAMPVLWRGQAIGWANVSRTPEGLSASLGYVGGRPTGGAAFRAGLQRELQRLRECLSEAD